MSVLDEKDLLLVENPARYCGGEYHSSMKESGKAFLHTAICFPDLYEIGMSNHSIRIIYDLLNRIEDVFCDRVFSVAKDYEAMLRETGKRLTTLDERRELKDLDFLGISIGYELGATNMLQVLDLGGITMESAKRTEGEPIVICGGPATTNPLPFSRFVDFSYVGEAENGLSEVIDILREGKRNGWSRAMKIEKLKQLDFLWYPGKKLATKRFSTQFTNVENGRFTYFVVPNFKVAQDNGIVEIMRGCPNGCRFCNAGQYYKPYRQKSQAVIMDQVGQYVDEFGYREVTLSSLSSGDYPHIKELVQNLNALYMARHVSFSLPSLKVSTFNLDVLQQLSEVRKSGLTFAIETPMTEWQKSVNKIVDVQVVIDIILEAKRRGWKLAKFYFMIGLPFVEKEGENDAIAEFLGRIHDATRIGMNINVGTFIPKPHTAFQWAPELTVEQSQEQLSALKKMIMQRVPGCKVSYHEPFTSYLEGMISRGDERYGEVIQAAYENGCRLDAWDEHMDKDAWKKAIASASYDPEGTLFTEGFPLDKPLPWDCISLRVGKEFLKKECEKAKKRELTTRCEVECEHMCGACSKEFKVQDDREEEVALLEKKTLPSYPVRQVVFTYVREGRALFISHINAMRNWEMSFQRSGLEVKFTEGFNPKPRLEFVNPLSLGFKGEEEVMMAEMGLPDGTTEREVGERLQKALNEGYTIKDVLILPPDPTGRKETLAKYMQGALYRIDTQGNEEYESQIKDKPGVTETGVHQYEVKTVGETNLVKYLFGKEADKFKIAKEIDITRLKILAGNDEDDYLSFFKKRKGIWSSIHPVTEKV